MSLSQPQQSIEFCGCATYPPGEECGMVVCWKCEQIVARTDEEGAITTQAMQAEIERLRNVIGELYMARGGSRWDLYVRIKRAFRASTLTATASTGDEARDA